MCVFVIARCVSLAAQVGAAKLCDWTIACLPAQTISNCSRSMSSNPITSTSTGSAKEGKEVELSEMVTRARPRFLLARNSILAFQDKIVADVEAWLKGKRHLNLTSARRIRNHARKFIPVRRCLTVEQRAFVGKLVMDDGFPDMHVKVVKVNRAINILFLATGRSASREIEVFQRNRTSRRETTPLLHCICCIPALLQEL